MCETINTKFGIVKAQPDGYLMVKSRKEGNHGKLLHRLVFEDFYQIKLPRHIHIHHLDGNKANNEIWNLIPLTASEHSSLHGKDKSLSNETKKKISETKKGSKNSLDCRFKLSKNNSTTGIFNLRKDKCKQCKNETYWRFFYIDEDGNEKRLSSTNLCKLKERVLSLGLDWIVLDEEKAKITLKECNQEVLI